MQQTQTGIIYTEFGVYRIPELEGGEFSLKHSFSFRQYRTIDLGLFALVLLISESLIVRAARFWFPDQLYTVSVVAAVVAIVMMRWGKWAAIHAIFGALIFCLNSGANGKQILIYCFGNLLGLLMLFPRQLLGWEKIRNDGFLSVCFGLLTLLLMQLGRALIALAMGALLHDCLGFFTTDALSLLFTGVIIWIARRLDGIFEDQKHYLLRIHKEEEKGGY